MGNCSTQQTKDKLNRYNQTIETVPKKIEYRQPLHDGPILSIVRLSHKYMALCSEDKRLSVVDREKVMNDVDYRPKYFLGHTKAVNRVVLLDQMLWSASRDRSIRQVNA